MTKAAALEQIRRSLQENAGGYLKNTIHISGETCSNCRGTQMRDGYPTCYSCGWLYGSCADRVGSVIYGVSGTQTERLMYGYKSTAPGPSHVQLVTSLVTLALVNHIACVDTLAGKNVAYWATVPSLRKPPGSPHRFREILVPILGEAAEIRVSASNSVNGPRDLNPANYVVQTVPPGAHVLLLDDTYASGGHIQSVALALKQSGAGQVSALAVARWLNIDDARTKRVYNEHIKDRPYSADVCPWTGGQCPPQPGG